MIEMHQRYRGRVGVIVAGKRVPIGLVVEVGIGVSVGVDKSGVPMTLSTKAKNTSSDLSAGVSVGLGVDDGKLERSGVALL